MTSEGLGLTLTAASIVIFAEVYWTPGIMQQCEDRAHRIGQQKCVNIYYLFGEETFDEIIFPMLKFKDHIIAHTLDGIDSDFTMKTKKMVTNG